MTKDYYDVLEISKKATQEDIKKAYRKLAREHHPDMAKENDKAAAEARFKEINEAYQVLSDPQKRQMYDQYGHRANFNGTSGFNNQGNWGPFNYTYTSQGENPFGDANFDPFDIFESIFGSRGFGNARRPRKGKNLYYELRISFADAVKGLEKEINAESGRMHIKIPKGVRDGSEIRFEGKGMPLEGFPNGDLYLTVRYSSPREFEIIREDILINLEIDFVTAILGGEIEIPVVDENKKDGIGKAKLKIPSGTQPKTRFIVKGKGMPRLQSNGNGDAYIQVEVSIPKKVSRKQRNLLEEYINS